MADKEEIEQLRSLLKNLPRLSDKNRPSRIAKSKKDFWFFIKTYFPHHVEEVKLEVSLFRKHIHKNILKLEKKHKNMAFSAYRGAAKSTLFSRLYTLWRLARNDARNIILASDTIDIAKGNLEFIKVEIEDNPNYSLDFKVAMGSKWTEEEVIIKIEKKLSKIKCFGTGKKIRGTNFLGSRPDLIIIDDMENDENVESKAQRDKLYTWFKKAIMKLPDRKKPYHLFVIGTFLHHDSVLARISKRKDFYYQNFPLVLSFPKNMHAWEKLYLLDIDEARSRYEKRRAYYDADFVLDDEEINKFDIMMEYFEDKDSFLSELQNNPISHDKLIFPHYRTFEEMPLCDAYYIAVDPALGKSKKGDYFGLGFVGYKKKTGKLYGSVQGYKITAYKMISQVIALYVKLSRTGRPVKIAIETVAFQDFYKDMVKLVAKEAAGIHLPVVEMNNRASKELRIEGIAPLVNDGTIMIDKNSHLLIEELDTYPKSAHDDLLDTLEMAYRLHSKKTISDYAAINKAIKETRFKFLKIKDTYV